MAPLRDALTRLGDGRDLSAEETYAAVSEILRGEAAEPLIASFLTALRFRGETHDELAGAVRAVRERMLPLGSVPAPLLDTCGTGGDLACTVNVSTAAAVVVAACGVRVAKHGNRAATGNSGSAEVLAELGIPIEAEPEVLCRSLQEVGIAFLFAPRFHPHLRPLIAVRRQLPFRTLFNLIGPLANPAQPGFQLIGVAGEQSADLIAGALVTLGIERAAVVTGDGHLDEVTLSGPTSVRWVEGSRLSRQTWQPEDFGLRRGRVEDLRVAGPSESASRLLELFAGQRGPIRDIVLANAAAALWVAGRVNGLREGVDLAATAIESGAAQRLLANWRAITTA
jgi:anthranilate phosphoribosyltransferase